MREKETQKVQTIELTGKRLKAGQALGCLMMILAIVAFIAGLKRAGNPGDTGVWLLFGAVLLLVGGLMLSVAMKCLVWWRHR